MRDDRERFAALDTEIIAINPASVDDHCSYVSKNEFNFSILSDKDGKVAKKYKSLMRFGKIVMRTVYVLDKKGIIRFAERGMPENDTLFTAIKEISD